MKIFKLLPVMLIVGSFNLNAQSVTAEQFPEMIIKIVTQKFPDVEDIDWRMRDNLYEVEIDGPNESNTWLRFDQSGKLIAQKEYVSPAFLPANISKIVSENYSEFNALNTEKMVASGKTYFQVALRNKKGKVQNLVFSEAGEITMEVPYWD